MPESTDLGEHWTQLQTGTELSLMGGTALANGGAAIVGANGIVLMRAKAGKRHHLEAKPSKVTRRLSGDAEVSKNDVPRIKKLLGR